MKIDIQGFSAAVTAVSPELIPDNVATSANNVNLYAGRIEPIKQVVNISRPTALNVNAITRIRARDGISKLVDGSNSESLVESPLARDAFDRMYWTRDNGAPLVATYAQMESLHYPLGIDPPSHAPSVSVSVPTPPAPVDGEPTFEPSDVYLARVVFVEESQWGELSAPSPASSAAMLREGGTLAIQLPSAPTSGHWTHRQVFMTDQLGSFRFVQRVAVSSQNLSLGIDSVVSNLGEALNQIEEGVLNTPPRDSLRGLVSLPGGVLAGFDGNVVAFSRPYLPHAWPVDYELSLDGRIQGMAVAASGLVVITDKKPYLIVGGDPAGMSPIQLDITEPCFAPKAIVDMGAYVVYPSNNGLIAIAGQDNRNIMEQVIGQKDWDLIKHVGAIAVLFDGKYWYFSPTGQGFIFDPQTGSFSFHAINAAAAYADNLTGELFTVQGGQTYRYSRDNPSSSSMSWQSKQFVIGSRGSMGALKINGGGSVDFTMDYMQGSDVIHQFSSTLPTNEPVRLPAVRAERIQFRVNSQHDISRIQVAASMRELT